MDRLISFYKPTQAIGTQGEVTITFAKQFSAMAYVNRSAQEQTADQNLNQDIDLTVTTYKRGAVDTRWRVEIDGAMYEISGMSPFERPSAWMELQLTKI